MQCFNWKSSLAYRFPLYVKRILRRISSGFMVCWWCWLMQHWLFHKNTIVLSIKPSAQHLKSIKKLLPSWCTVLRNFTRKARGQEIVDEPLIHKNNLTAYQTIYSYIKKWCTIKSYKVTGRQWIKHIDVVCAQKNRLNETFLLSAQYPYN